MRMLAAVVIAILMGPALQQLQAVSAEQPDSGGYAPVPSRLLIKFKTVASELEKAAVLRQNGAVVVEEIEQIKVKVLGVPEKASDRILESLSRNSAVEYVEMDAKISPSFVPNDPHFSKQWHLGKIESALAWDSSRGAGQTIAVLDTGIDYSHPDLAAKIVNGYNFYDNNSDIIDVCGHGTSTAGVAAAITDNGIGVAGVAADSKIMPIKITDPECYGYYSAMVKGLTYAADSGVRIANISFRVFDGSAIKDAAKYMYDKGGWTVASAGNTGKLENYPDNPYILSVGATESGDARASYSSYGPYVDLSAPGSAIYTTVKGGYGSKSGTSFSAPIVAGILSLAFAGNPALTPANALEALKQSSVDLGAEGYDYYYGYGRVNAYWALQAAMISTEDTEPPVLAPPADQVVWTASDAGRVVFYPLPTATDNIGVVSGPSCSPASGSFFALGTTVVTCTAADAAGNIGTATFRVIVQETLPLAISIVNPAAGATVKGTVTVSISVSGGSTMDTVEIFVDGSLVSRLQSSPYEYSWNTRSLSDDIHIITAKASDASGSSATDTIEVKVANKHKGRQ